MHYESEPIGGGNPYYRCKSCKRSDPEISVRGHRAECEYLKENRATELLNEVLDLATFQSNDVGNDGERFEAIADLIRELKEIVK